MKYYILEYRTKYYWKSYLEENNESLRFINFINRHNEDKKIKMKFMLPITLNDIKVILTNRLKEIKWN